MSLSASADYDVADSAVASADVPIIVQPSVGFGTGDGRGRLVHPGIGDSGIITYDYLNTPDEVVNFDGAPIAMPVWRNSKTLTGAIDTLWPRRLRGTRVIERWLQGDVGAPLAHLRMLAFLVANPPDPTANEFVKWYPSYGTSAGWYVVLSNLRAGAQEYTLSTFLKKRSFAPTPVELERRIVGLIEG